MEERWLTESELEGEGEADSIVLLWANRASCAVSEAGWREISSTACWIGRYLLSQTYVAGWFGASGRISLFYLVKVDF